MDPKKAIKDSIKSSEVSSPETLAESVATSKTKFNYKAISEFLDKFCDEYKAADKLLTAEQKQKIVDYVNAGIFSRKTIKNTIMRICEGWKTAPKTVDDRINRLVSINRFGATGSARAKQVRDSAGLKSDDEQAEMTPKNLRPISRIEGGVSMPGFQEAFEERLEKFKEQYQVEIADEMIVRLLISNDIHLDNILSKQSRCFSEKRLDQCRSILEQNKICLETLKLARRQRNQDKDEGGEKEAAVRFEQFRKNKTVSIPKEEQDKIDRAKAGIAEFLAESSGEDQDIDDLEEDGGGEDG